MGFIERQGQQQREQIEDLAEAKRTRDIEEALMSVPSDIIGASIFRAIADGYQIPIPGLGITLGRSLDEE